MKKIVIVMTYYDRERQMCKTLKTIYRSAHNNYSIIIIDDASPRPIETSADAHIIRIEPAEKRWSGIVVPFNIGIAHALTLEPDIIIIQNPECAHIGDVLMYANNNVTDDNYISFGCWSLNKGLSLDEVERSIAADDPFRTDGGSTGWYNHPRWNPRPFHFCTAMTADTMRQLNGFDERFKDGLGCDDCDLVRRLQIMMRGIIITDETEPFVVHQWHSRAYQTQEKYQHNTDVYNHIPKNTYRAQHLITEDFS